VRIVKVARRENRRDTGFAHAWLRSGSSRMRRKSPVRFLGERVAATPLAYPTCDMKLLEQFVCYGYIVKQTCGSVRSSPSALAWLVTAGSEAAETMHLHLMSEESSVRITPRLPASTRSEG